MQGEERDCPSPRVFHTRKLSRPDIICRGRLTVVGNCNGIPNTKAVCFSGKPDSQVYTDAVHCDIVISAAVHIGQGTSDGDRVWILAFPRRMLMCGKVSHGNLVELTAAPLFPIIFCMIRLENPYFHILKSVV